jgi:FAD/FMN-containing dehydrogenase
MVNILNQIKKDISGWSGFPKHQVNIFFPSTLKDVVKLIKDKKNMIARGNGRSYGDSSINKNCTIDMKNFNKFNSFNHQTGILVAEAGVVLEDVIKTFSPKGWFPFVTPGSKYVTLGGMVACDVHGKNHHKEGSFSNYIEWIELINYEGHLIKCSNNINSDLFKWTVGGMGLTGIITKVCIKLRSIETSFIRQTKIVTKNINQTIEVFENTMNTTYSVAWIDCLNQNKEGIGRSIVFLGEHAKYNELDKSRIKKTLKVKTKKKMDIIIYFPEWFLSNWIMKIFNSIYYFFLSKSKKKNLVDFDDFFYPLDRINDWNKIYGKKGFIQFQCVLPLNNSKEGLFEILNYLSKFKIPSFLSVLKRFGAQNSKFSFPTEGYTLALDFPIKKNTFSILDRLDEITVKHGGRFYLAKDSRINKQIFKQSDIRIKKFVDYRNKNNLVSNFNSLQSNRLEI